jgi:aliphatic nitrilase
LGLISLAKAAADPAGHYARPDVTRLLLDKTPGDRVVARQRHEQEMPRNADAEMPAPMQRDGAAALRAPGSMGFAASGWPAFGCGRRFAA